MKRKFCHGVAPSMVAASYSDGDTVCRPASSVIATKGTPRQILANITQMRASVGSPRKSILWLMRPNLISDQEMIENCASKIHQNAIADKTVGTTKGISTIERSKALRGRRLFKSKAR